MLRVSQRSNLWQRRLVSFGASVPRGLKRQPIGLAPGETAHGFRLNKVTPVPELNLTAYELKHERTDARLLHIDCADTNNVFSVAFRTPPVDSTGVFHILEHCVLCSSKKYQEKDAFFNMINRSVNTYMNAWTSSDATSYPFSTQHAQDYLNLLSVYLDCAFFPNLHRHDFDREGHRLEPTDPNDVKSPLVYQGIVFNEMKGALTDSDSVFGVRLQQAILPGTPYENESGGEPSKILDLTYEQLREAHARHYHPSNAWFYTYGDLPLLPRLQFIEEEVLRHFERKDARTTVPDARRLAEPTRVETTFPPDAIVKDDTKQSKVSIAFLTSNVTDTFQAFALGCLSSLLTSGPMAPLYDALITEKMGANWAPGTGYHSDTRQTTFGVGLQGINVADVPKIEKRIFEVLEKSAVDGFPAERIDALLHQIELGKKHISTKFGMNVFSGVLKSWMHGGDPVASLTVNKHVTRLREELARGPFFQALIRKYLLDNPHRVVLVGSPDQEFVARAEKAEAERLAGETAKISEQERARIFERTLKTLEDAAKKPGESTLPRLTLADIPRSPIPTTTVVEPIEGSEGMRAQYNYQPTNGIVYVRMLLDNAGLDPALRKYFPLYTGFMTSLGAGKRDFKEFSLASQTSTGGIGVGSSVLSSIRDSFALSENVLLTSHALERNVPRMYELIGDVLDSPRFDDRDRLHSLIVQSANDMVTSIASSGNAYAATRASACLTPGGSLSEAYGGLSFVEFMQQLATRTPKELDDVVESLRKLHAHVMRRGGLRVSVVAEPQTVHRFDRELSACMSRLSTTPPAVALATPERPRFDANPFSATFERHYFPFPFPVNYVARAFPGVPVAHEDYAKLKVMSHLLTNQYLLPKVRFQGGAYGAGAGVGDILTLTSYRDPNTVDTLAAFDASAAWVEKNEYSDTDLEGSKISEFASLDYPVSPSGRGHRFFVGGVPDDFRQQHRDRLRAVTRDDIVDVARRYLAPNRPHTTVIVGAPGNTALSAENAWAVHEQKSS